MNRNLLLMVLSVVLFGTKLRKVSALKTHKNIAENLPEAVPFLPPPMSNALVVNFSSLQKKLNKQPEVSKQVVA